jgi:hypothetical protein
MTTESNASRTWHLFNLSPDFKFSSLFAFHDNDTEVILLTGGLFFSEENRPTVNKMKPLPHKYYVGIFFFT